MTEVGDGGYKYNFTTFDQTKDYLIRCDGGGVLPIAERYAFSGNNFVGETVIAGAVWDELLSGHTLAGSAADALTIIRQVEVGHWKIVSSQLIFYDDADNPLVTFNLRDKDGNTVTAEANAPAERIPV
jgi:hypothetical protein